MAEAEEEQEKKAPITPLGDTIFTIPAQNTAEGVETSRLARDVVFTKLYPDQDTQIDLSDTSVAERQALSQKRFVPPQGRLTIAIRATAKTGTEVLDNFDSLLGGLSYAIAMLCSKAFVEGKTLEGFIFAVIAILLAIAKHRLPPGWITEILNAPAGEIRTRMAAKYKDIESTFKG